MMRTTYDEICGYKGAWKYVGLDGAEHRRYQISVQNTLNFDSHKESSKPYKRDGYMNWEASSYNHNNKVYSILRDYHYNQHDESWLRDKMLGLGRKDCVQFMIWQLGECKPWDWTKERVFDNTVIAEPSEDYLRLKDISDRLERERRLKALEMAPRAADDWKTVYNWELTKSGKIKTFEK